MSWVGSRVITHFDGSSNDHVIRYTRANDVVSGAGEA